MWNPQCGRSWDIPNISRYPTAIYKAYEIHGFLVTHSTPWVPPVSGRGLLVATAPPPRLWWSSRSGPFCDTRWLSMDWFKGTSSPETHGFLPSNFWGFPVKIFPSSNSMRLLFWGVQWIGLRENLQENPKLNGKIYNFRWRCSLKPIHWGWTSELCRAKWGKIGRKHGGVQQ